MLSRVPAGELIDSPRRAPVRSAAEVLFSDTSWRPCLIVAWARYRGGWAAPCGKGFTWNTVSLAGADSGFRRWHSAR